MAIEVIQWVFTHSRAKNSARLVLLAVADHRHALTGAHMSQRELKEKTLLGERTIRDAVDQLVGLGELEVITNSSQFGVHTYRVLMAKPAGASVQVEDGSAADLAGAAESAGPSEQPGGSASESMQDSTGSPANNAGAADPAGGPGGEIEQPGLFRQVNGRSPANPAGAADLAGAAESAGRTVSTKPKNSSSKSSSSRRSTRTTNDRDDVAQLCDRLADWLIKNGSRTPSITEEWRNEARRLLDIDKVPLDKALALIDWCQRDGFWAANIQSMPTFRKQYDQLRMKATDEWKKQHRPGNGSSAGANRTVTKNASDFDDLYGRRGA